MAAEHRASEPRRSSAKAHSLDDSASSSCESGARHQADLPGKAGRLRNGRPFVRRFTPSIYSPLTPTGGRLLGQPKEVRAVTPTTRRKDYKPRLSDAGPCAWFDRATRVSKRGAPG